MEEAGEKPQKEEAVAMALVHDMEEMFSGDILTPFKHYSPEVRQAIQKVNKEVVPQAFEGLPESMKQKYVALWNEESEQVSLEAKIVKAAGRLSLLAKCAEEVSVGNEYFEKIYELQLQKLHKLNEPWWQKIKNEVLPEQS